MKEQQNKSLAINRARVSFALLAVLMVVIGQTILYATPVRQDTGIPPFMWLSLAGVVLFILSLTLPIPGFLQKLFSHLPLNGQIGWIISAIVLSILAAISMTWFRQMINLSYMPVLSLWAGSAACYIVAFAHFDLHSLDWKRWLRNHRWEFVALGIVILVAVILRFYNLGAIPRVLNGDEGWVGLSAQSTFTDRLANPFALWNNMSAMYLQAVNLALIIFGSNAFGVRLLPAIGGVLSVLTTYLLAKQVAGKRIALIAAALLAFSHFDLNFSRTAGSDYIFTSMFIPLILYFLLGAIEKHSLVKAALAGSVLALFLTTNLMAQVLVGFLLALSLAMLLFRSWRKSNGRELAVLWGGFIVLIIPEAVWIWQHPEDFFARLGASGTFQTGWLAQTVAATGQSPILILTQRVIHAFLSLIYYPSLAYYGSPVPPLTLLSAALFLIGLGLCLFYMRDFKYLVLNGYFWGFTLAIGIFALPPSADTYRMLTVLPVATLMAAIGFDTILSAIGLAWHRTRVGYVLFTSIVLFSLLATNLWTYFGEFAGRCLYGDNTVGRFASYMGSYVGTLNPEDSVYLLSNDLYRYGTHASTDFLSGSHPIINVSDSVNTLAIKPDEAIIANPDRFHELEGWAANHSGGQLQYFYDCSKVILVVYQIP
ncbi:MAG TPA: glycosyltransferase family 39 protein [Anaerolineales bacterium]